MRQRYLFIFYPAAVAAGSDLRIDKIRALQSLRAVCGFAYI
jgi:hypothetical protein